jgi:hypothetical protein
LANKWRLSSNTSEVATFIILGILQLKTPTAAMQSITKMGMSRNKWPHGIFGACRKAYDGVGHAEYGMFH